MDSHGCARIASQKGWNRFCRILIAFTALFGGVTLSGCDAFGSYESRGRATYASEPDVRVRIRKNVPTTRVDGPMRVVVRPIGGRPQLVEGGVTITPSPQGLVITDERSRTIPVGYGSEVEILPREMTALERQAGEYYRPGDAVNVDGQTFPGFVIVAPASAASAGAAGIDVINVMPLETYLPGVLARELYNNWPRQAFEAQSVAARSYALHERERSRSARRTWDLEATTADQAYGGLTSLPVAVEAVRATRGMILTELPTGGGVLRAYYSSTCGGRPASAKDVWPSNDAYYFNNAPPLQATERKYSCQTAPLYRWETVRKDLELSARIRAWGRDAGRSVKSIGTLRKLEVQSTNSAGRPAKYRLIDDKGNTHELFAEELRLACNFPAAGFPMLARPSLVTQRENRAVASGDMEMRFFADNVQINGRGYGHGVGLCQFCAKGFAERGLDWPTMLKEFYPGAGLKKAY